MKSLRDVMEITDGRGLVTISDSGILEFDPDGSLVADNVPLNGYLNNGYAGADHIYLWSDIENKWLYSPTYKARTTGRVPAKNYQELYDLDDDIIRNRPIKNLKIPIISVGTEITYYGFDGIVIANENESRYGYCPKGMVIIRNHRGVVQVGALEVEIK